MASAPPYFRNLNGLRFGAALVVVLHHVAQTVAGQGRAGAWDLPVVREVGGLAVTFFFVLSGFLITHLLLAERERQGRVDVRQFYLRRVLRIWPLYFGVLALAYALAPGPWPPGVLWAYMLFLPNFLGPAVAPVPYAGHLWSIGVEEQFYLLWPWLVRRGVDVGQACLLIVLGFVLLRGGLWALHVDGYLVERTRIDCMALGGLGAAWLARGQAGGLLAWPARWGAAVGVPLLLLMEGGLGAFRSEGFAALFLVLIANFAYRPEAMPDLERRGLVYLGKISYGIYMLHPFAIGACLWVTAEPWLAPCVVALTIALAALSYEVVERRVLALGRRAVVEAVPAVAA